MGKLVLYLPDGSVHDIVLDKERMTIGRRADNDVCLPFPAVSGEHASVVTILADSFLEDQGSTNGTLVNGKPIVKHFLRDQDVVDIGRQRLVYLADDAGEAQPLAPDILLRGVRELDEQVARARSTRASARDRAGFVSAHGNARASGNATGQAAGARSPGDATIPPRSDRENGGSVDGNAAPVDDAIARDFANSMLGDTQDEATKNEVPPRGALGALGDLLDAADSSRALGYGERTQELGALIEARRNRNRASKLKHSGDERNESGKADPAPGRGPTREPGDDRSRGEGRANANGMPDSAAVATARIKVMSGPSSGRELALTKDVTIGRIGLQVAALRRVGASWHLSRVEGSTALVLNGAPLPAGGAALKVGDSFTVAGTQMLLVGA